MAQESIHRQEILMRILGIRHANILIMPDHFNFSTPSRRFMIIGAMGSGKTEYSLKIFNDAKILRQKTLLLGSNARSGLAERCNVAFVRFSLDEKRFLHAKKGELYFRGGHQNLGKYLFTAKDSFEIEDHMNAHPEIGTWIIDEASFYDERLAYIVLEASEKHGKIFILPTLALNFRNLVFNPTAALLLEQSTDIYLLSAYCEHPECMEHAYSTYRYYTIDGKECPAPFFDPLIIIGGDKRKYDTIEPDYVARCAKHHMLPAKEYTYLVLKPLGVLAASGNTEALMQELSQVTQNSKDSQLFSFLKDDSTQKAMLKLPYLAERMLLYLFAEQNLLTREQCNNFCNRLELNLDYIKLRLSDNAVDHSFL